MGKDRLIRVNGENGLGFVKRAMLTVIKDLVGGIDADTRALSYIVGGSNVVLEKMAEKGKGLEITPRPTSRGTRWLMRLTGGGVETSKQAYLRVFGEAAKEVVTGQRMDASAGLQEPVYLLFGLLPPSVQTELRQEGKAPEIITKHNPAF